MYLEKKLHDLGYEVVALVSSGNRAIERATQDCPDVVLMDIQLPGAIDGIEAARNIWERLHPLSKTAPAVLRITDGNAIAMRIAQGSSGREATERGRQQGRLPRNRGNRD